MRRALALALCFALAACGFRPMYGRSLGPALSSIYVEPIAEREGYELRNSLIDALQSDGDKAGKAYRLKITLNESSQGIALQNDATITRYNDTLTVSYVLADNQGKELTHGSLTGLSSYNVATAPYATQSARRDADTRALQDIAQRLRLDLGVYFSRHR